MGNEAELTQNNKTPLMTCQIGRKEKNMKKRYWTLAVALLLVVACCVPVSASEEAIGDMGSCDIHDSKGVYQGEGTLWNDSAYEYTLGGSVSSVSYANVSVSVTIYYDHYDLGIPLSSSDSSSATSSYGTTATVYISPNEGTATSGSGSYTINSASNSISSGW